MADAKRFAAADRDDVEGRKRRLAARVEELSTRAATRATQITNAERRIESLRMTAAQAGDSLLRLHGEQKQAEEALVHQSEALRRREASEHELLESSLGARAC